METPDITVLNAFPKFLSRRDVIEVLELRNLLSPQVVLAFVSALRRKE